MTSEKTTDEARIKRAVKEALAEAAPANLVSVGGLATRWGVSTWLVRKWVREGCPHLRAGGVIRLNPGPVEQWLQHRGRRGGAKEGHR